MIPKKYFSKLPLAGMGNSMRATASLQRYICMTARPPNSCKRTLWAYASSAVGRPHSRVSMVNVTTPCVCDTPDCCSYSAGLVYTASHICCMSQSTPCLCLYCSGRVRQPFAFTVGLSDVLIRQASATVHRLFSLRTAIRLFSIT